MNKILTLSIFLSSLFSNGQNIIHPENNDAFLDNEVADVKISIDQNYLNTLLTDSLYSDFHFPATFVYNTSLFTDTILNIGFRVRGNTSRDASKKSFKVSFNEFVTEFKDTQRKSIDLFKS